MNDPRLKTIRESYDGIASEYATHLSRELDNKPMDRELLTRFAQELRDGGEICDMGCGPGQVARFLCDAGAHVFGLDLSEGMVEEARRLHPEIAFRQGNMLALDLPDHSLAGITAFYAIVNLERELLPQVFREMHRVLSRGGLLLLTFHVGDETMRPPALWDRPITMDFFQFPAALIRQGLEGAGFRVEDVIEREPYPGVEHPTRRAYIFARKPHVPAVM